MSKADVLALVTTLSLSQADGTTVSRYYDDIVSDYGSKALLTNIEIVACSANNAEITLPSQAIELIQAFYDDQILSLERIHDMTYTAGEQWRDVIGKPFALIREGLSNKTFRLYPKPDVPNSSLLYPHGQPFGADYPEYAVSVMFTETRANLPIWIELPTALLILEREFNRESNHKDVRFGKMCGQLGSLMLIILGVPWP